MPRHLTHLLIAALFASSPLFGASDPYESTGWRPDPETKILSEIRAADRRKIPLEVALRTANQYSAHGPVEVTIMVTNLFDRPIYINRRLLVNHPRLEGEVSFVIEDPDGKRSELQRLITPLSVHDDDFVVLAQGQSVQRTVDLADYYRFPKRGTYRVKVSYHNSIDKPMGDQRAWKGYLVSDPVEIVVN